MRVSIHGAYQGISEIGRVLAERLVSCVETQVIQIQFGKDGNGPRVSFEKRVDLPKECDGVAKPLEFFLRERRVNARLLGGESSIDRHAVGKGIGIEHAVAVKDGLLLYHALAFEFAWMIHIGVEVLEYIGMNAR